MTSVSLMLQSLLLLQQELPLLLISKNSLTFAPPMLFAGSSKALRQRHSIASSAAADAAAGESTAERVFSISAAEILEAGDVGRRSHDPHLLLTTHFRF